MSVLIMRGRWAWFGCRNHQLSAGMINGSSHISNLKSAFPTRQIQSIVP